MDYIDASSYLWECLNYIGSDDDGSDDYILPDLEDFKVKIHQKLLVFPELSEINQQISASSTNTQNLIELIIKALDIIEEKSINNPKI